jgi:hypothetical protein
LSVQPSYSSSIRQVVRTSCICGASIRIPGSTSIVSILLLLVTPVFCLRSGPAAKYNSAANVAGWVGPFGQSLPRWRSRGDLYFFRCSRQAVTGGRTRGVAVSVADARCGPVPRYHLTSALVHCTRLLLQFNLVSLYTVYNNSIGEDFD